MAFTLLVFSWVKKIIIFLIKEPMNKSASADYSAHLNNHCVPKQRFIKINRRVSFLWIVALEKADDVLWIFALAILTWAMRQ